MKIFTTTPFRSKATALLFAVAMLLAAPAITYGQIYVSIPGSGVGTGILKNFTTGGASTPLASGLNIPEGLAFSGTDLYVALNTNNGIGATIVKYDSNGSSSVFSSNTGSPSTMGLAFDSAGNLYAANTGNQTIVKFAPGVGTPSPFVTTGTSGNGAYGLAVDSASNVYAAIRNNNTIVSYNSSGGTNWTTSLAGGSGPVGLALNGSTLYVANYSASTIDTYSTSTGAFIANFATSSEVSGPFGLAFSGSTLYVANDGGTGSISMFTAAHVGTSFDAGGFPAYIAVSAVPEPSTYAAIAGAAMLGVAVWRRRRRSTSAATLAVDAAA